ncbi:membrane protein BRI3-like [Macrobrachium nipponense]|uniref:membrane protein BRI3-like n=1 Tax=Macrobrachium nipponense TaxID=159736 RepID=UPI0030C7A820
MSSPYPNNPPQYSYAPQQPPPSYPPQQPPPPQYMPGPSANYNNQNHSIQIVNTGSQPQASPVVYVANGSCPNCRVGFFVDDFTCCGICLAIFFFPIGLICCFAMRERKCSNCGLTFG